MIGFPNESPKHNAQWLNLLADLHIPAQNAGPLRKRPWPETD